VIDFRILGPLEVRDHERPVEVGRQKQKALLALLLLRRGELVSSDALVDGLWGNEPPRTARAALQNYVSQLRAALGPGIVVSGTGGYVLDVAPEQLDLCRFERLAADGRSASGEERARKLREALTLWRGPPLAGLEFEPFATLECVRLEELRATALEELVDAELALGSGGELVAELEALIAEHPFRERLRGQLMLALYRAGRQVEALEAYQETRRVLVDELGIEPSEALRELQRAILRHDPALAGRDREQVERRQREEPRRTTVTLLFAELLGNEPLDPEVLRATSGKLLTRIRAVLEKHGARVEQRAGEEVMAIFGVPRLHEDDVLRAARAAIEVRSEVDELAPVLAQAGRAHVALRAAIDTGEVLAGDDDAGHGFIVGPAVSRTKRLLEAARAGETLLGSRSIQLLGGAVVTAARDDRLDASCLVEVRQASQLPERRSDTPLLGRDAELSMLEAAFTRIQAERRCRVVILVGEAGIGKTRLAQELSEKLEPRATILAGHCAPYGEGTAYLPVVEIVRAVRATGTLPALLGDDPDAELVERRLAELAGEATGAGSEGEQWWAVRRLFEALASARPLIVVLEDLQWAESRFLDLIDDIERRTRVPMLLVGATRPELLDSRPDWTNKEAVHLRPLPNDVSGLLVANLASLAADLADRVVETAGGNPLFLEQLLAYATEERAVEGIPPSLQALLGARLDRLKPPERSALQRAAVAGNEFPLGAVEALWSDIDPLTLELHLDELLRKGLIRPSGRPDARSRSFRFHHVLIRDAAYRSIPRQLLSELHERLADWLDVESGTREEIVGYHLERAYRCSIEVGAPSGRARRLAADAGDHLGAAGLRAARAGETQGAVGLLERASVLATSAQATRRDLLTELGLVLWRRGDVERAEETLEWALSMAHEEHDKRAELRARLELANLRLFLTPEGGAEQVLTVAADAIPVLEQLDDERSLGRIWYVVAFVCGGLRCQYGESAEAAERARHYFRSAGWPVAPCLQELAAALYYGPTDVAAGGDQAQHLLVEADRGGEANVLAFQAGLEAMASRLDDARATVRRAREIYDDLGWTINVTTNCATVTGDIELLAGDAPAAEAVLIESCGRLEAWGERAHLATQSAQLGEAVYRQGRYEEALRWAQLAGDCAATDDAGAQFLWRALRAKAVARRGDTREAEALSSEAVERAAQTDALTQHANVLLDRAEVLRLSGKDAPAGAATSEAMSLLEAKGNIAGLRRTRSLLEAPRGM
jgi:DNA-binding SARP family transcriptional activator